jgi:hypothetical protein
LEKTLETKKWQNRKKTDTENLRFFWRGGGILQLFVILWDVLVIFCVCDIYVKDVLTFLLNFLNKNDTHYQLLLFKIS